ncbi:MAG: phosphoenolpyruvate--protein phosphotransferase [Candidatus Firestonebacteria bacterium]
MRKVFKGIGASSGVVIGRAMLIPAEEFIIIKHNLKDSDIPGEVIRFKNALKKTKKEIKEIQIKVKKEIGSKHSNIFVAHLLISEDPFLTTEVIKEIKISKVNSEYAFSQAINKFVDKLSKVGDEYLRERSNDIKDIGRRVLRNLTGEKRETLANLEEEIIVFAKDLSPSDTVTMQKDKVIGFCIDMGGKTSHTAIIARALEIPAVVGLGSISNNVNTDETVIVDGLEGIVIISPSSEDLKKYTEKREKLLQIDMELTKLRDLPAETLDGYKIELSANIEMQDEVKLILRHGAKGIGLYRTEFLFLNRVDLPTEEEQFKFYLSTAEALYPCQVIMRTLDLGGDKFLSNLGLRKEDNPFLGLRAIRLCLAKPELFKTQLRAILRASKLKNIKIMFPMISGVEEFRRAIKILKEVKNELKKDKIDFDDDIEVGVMIEIPSAALTSDILAKEADFFSIGTNDLIQYTLAIDRVNENIAYLYNPLHPSLIRELKGIVDSAHKEGKWVGMCGEMASDTAFTLLLLGLGFDELSTAPVSVPQVKKVIRSITLEEAKKIANDVLDMETLEEVKEYISHMNKSYCK